MRADPIRRAIDEDLVRVLYAQDPIAFFSHWFSIAVLVAIYWPHVPSPPLFIACFVFYALANCAGLALWICNRRYPQLVSPRDWIYLHALRGVLLYSGPGFAVWFAFQSPQTDLPLLHTVMLVTLAAGVFMSNGFDLLNFSTSIPFLLLPSIVLHFGSHTFDRTILAIVLAFFFCAINVYAMSYRKLFRQVVQARVDQQYLAQSLAAQKCVAEEASLAKTRFFAAASHDLRQPLHAIGLLAASLNDPAATPAQHAKTAGHIVYNVEALNQLFNQVLDLARLESGVTQVIRLHFRLSELFERVGSQYRPQAAAKGLALRIAPTSMVVYDDPVLLERVLSNLLSNAVRYTEQGAIWLGLRRAGRQKGGYIEVRDSGVGMCAARARAHLRGVLSGRESAARRAPRARARAADRQAARRSARRRVAAALGAGARLGVPLCGAGGRRERHRRKSERFGRGRPDRARAARAVHRRRSVDTRGPRESTRALGLQRARCA
ncbi:signal transduction histidine kinase [Paraburkholderia sp. WC7.3g]